MRRLLILAVVGLLLGLMAAAHGTEGKVFDPPDPAIWLSDPDGVDGVSGIEQGDHVVGSQGRVVVDADGADITIRAPGLEPGHAYTLWVVYFNDATQCVDGCNGPDFAAAGGGSIYGAGALAGPSGTATFAVDLEAGAGAEHVGETPPPPFATASYEPGDHNEFHVVVRSHGPALDGLVRDQLSSFGGGCLVNVGPAPGEIGDFPVPLNPGECGEIQLYVFS